MSYPQTRNLLPFVLQRTLMEKVIFVFSDKTFLDDGSFETVENEIEYPARVIALTSSEIQRLQEGGITINNGISIALNQEFTKVPDYVKRETDKLYRIVSYTYEEGASIFTASDLPGIV